MLTLQAPQESLTVFTPLGIRFWDPVRDTPVRDHLVVTARPEGVQGRVTSAFRTVSGLYAFQGLPGLHEVEYPSEANAGAPSSVRTRRFLIEVIDRLDRFLPVLFRVELPLSYRGVFSLMPQNRGLAAGELSRFFLFSAPTRLASSGLAAVRAQLVDATTGQPAAYALMELQVNGSTWYGVSDAEGGIAVLFPYPTFTSALLTSPPGMGRVSQSLQHWEMTIRVRYEPLALTFPVGSAIPDLRSIVMQAPGGIRPTQLHSPLSAPVAAWPQELLFGQELILRTDDLSTLWIQMAASS